MYHLVGDGRPGVVLVHGWMTSSRVWDAVIRELPADAAILAVDLRGSGGSERGEAAMTLERLTDDVATVIDQAGVGRFHLVGHSMGGQLAQLLAIRLADRVRSLALLNPVPLAGLPLPADVARWFREAGGQAEALGRILDAACRSLTSEDRARLLAVAVGIAPRTIAEVFAAWSAGLPAAPVGAITASTMVVATDDPFLPPALLVDAVAGRIPRATLAHLDGVGHYPQVEGPAATAALLADFWRRV